MPRQRFEDIFPSGTGLDIRSLLGQQAGYVQGLGSPGLSPEFGGTLAELLRTGAPVDTRGVESAASDAGMRAFRDISRQINEAMLAGGKGGSSAQTARLSEAGSDVASRIGEQIAQLRYGAGEAAAGRRVGALNPALAEGQLNLQAGTAQAGAGIDLLNLLKTLGAGGAGRMPELAGSRSTAQTYGKPTPGGGGSISTTSRVAPKGISGSQLAHNIAQGRWFNQLAGRGHTLGEYGRTKQLYTDPAMIAMLHPELAGPAIEAGKLGVGSFQAMQQGSAAATAANAPLMAQASKQDFIRQIIEKYGPYFAGLAQGGS